MNKKKWHYHRGLDLKSMITLYPCAKRNVDMQIDKIMVIVPGNSLNRWRDYEVAGGSGRATQKYLSLS